MKVQSRRLVDGDLYMQAVQAKQRRCPACGRRVGVLRRLFLEHPTTLGIRCGMSGAEVQSK